MEVQLTPRLSGNPGRFPNAIRQYRMRAGFSQRKLGQILGTKRGSVSSWERGHTLPNLRNAFRLAKTLGTLAEALYIDLYSPRADDGERHE